jgi:hypothetical protein
MKLPSSKVLYWTGGIIALLAGVWFYKNHTSVTGTTSDFQSSQGALSSGTSVADQYPTQTEEQQLAAQTAATQAGVQNAQTAANAAQNVANTNADAAKTVANTNASATETAAALNAGGSILGGIL